ncbi:phosphoribosylaminoimidazolesuccinocarboxamide synthase [Leptolyngbyaceae cyanobacterium CCMR0082]|uniref:Phosphoribosylaminoimidazolesuccinocarboxamide synthase n=2 Tax=Adonisia TaxID=2950183 RepID=A0A6M0S7G3_9CYAN|nr:phosphoribosylaminoimidazolesuccinocarboxamide synthase [Adonisia turfae CCMR0082]
MGGYNSLTNLEKAMVSLRSKTLFFSGITAGIVISWLTQLTPAWANCPDWVGSVEWHRPTMTAHFQFLQNQTSYPWGNARVFERIENGQVFLTEAFDTLDGEQKQQVLQTLFSFDSRDYLTEEDYLERLKAPGMGLSPYQVMTHEGRLLRGVYDGCTVFILLTEKQRYSWAYLSQGRSQPYNLADSLLRNAGQPSWRQVNFPIGAMAEKRVRLNFWKSIGYENRDWWIAWVPENGYFEINVPGNFDTALLEDYWQVADQNYRYMIVGNDGTWLEEKRF